ncbi:3-deoxy-8-phosphooctulonate synthase, partial [candidate division KSB1 bacterium]|nr:3-deoxy-8-phosphooctulonate synthase [candidate division KSB1 bacterium]
MKTINIGGVKIGGDQPIALIAGPCVIESQDLILTVAERVKTLADHLGMPFVFKSSYTKDNRSSATSFQGPGLEKGLAMLQNVKKEIGVPILSDV